QAAWSVDDEANKAHFGVQGEHINDLMFNKDLDVLILFYYCYKRKMAAQRQRADMDIEYSQNALKYIHFEIMAVTAF
ncbi:hypothetical protein MKX03_008660, partial [Papaver bracteatum]